MPFPALDRLHARVVRIRALWYFTAMTRILLAIAFIPSGMKKVMNVRFTTLPISDPVGFFFEAFYRTGIWYWFSGAVQVLAALLLLFPRTATVGALLYLPIVVNVMLITIGVGFQGTPVITVMMTLAAVYLVCWDYDKWRHLIPTFGRRNGPPTFSSRIYLLAPLGWALAGIAVYALAFALGIGAVDRGLGLAGFPILAALGAVFGVVTAWHARAMEVGTAVP